VADRTKIVLIGAGSVEFTRSLLADLCSFDELRGALEIALHDIDPGRLATAERLARYAVETTGAGHVVEAHLDRGPAFDGAAFLINEIQVGGYDATVRDFEIPRRYGVRQTIADTIGIGGIARGLRTIPVMVAMGDELAARCPDALLLSYTNPMAMVPWGVYAGSAFANVVGVCHSVRDTHAFLAELVGVPQDEITFRTAGFNHQCFVVRFERTATGEDLYPIVRERVAADPEGLGRRVRVELFRRFGFFPTESSEHSAEYVPWFLHDDAQIERFRIPVGEYLRRSDENLAEYAAMEAALAAGEPIELEPGSQLASEVVHAMLTGRPREVYGNVRNDDLIDGLPADACVEVPCTVDAGGVHPQRIGALPAPCLALNRTFLNVVELTVRAALEQRRDLVYQAALLDPNTAATLAPDRIVAMCDDLLEAHGDLIPEGIRRG
jgi:alpha-galactosidase